jgi:hypothetical protein
MPKSKKHPKDMTTEELAQKVFHPKVLKELKKIANPEKKDEGEDKK